MFDGKTAGILFESLCEKADSLVGNAFIFPVKKTESMTKANAELLHAHVGWELKIYLTPKRSII